MLPFSEACERNKAPILSVLKTVFVDAVSVLEIGSGTGQHAVFFSESLPHLTWQPSDFGEYLPGLEARLREHLSPNLQESIELDVRAGQWPSHTYGGVFSANSLHIMSWEAVTHFFEGVGKLLKSEGLLVVYGPFKYKGKYTSPSNQDFDQWLKGRDLLSGIRDFEAVHELAEKQGLELVADHTMPANNQCLVWQKS